MFIRYYCINLPDEIKRRESIEEIGKTAGISIKFVAAISGKEINLQTCTSYDHRRRAQFAKDLTPNEVACVLSHKKALNEFLMSDHDYAVILEDDAEFDNDFHKKVTTIATRVKRFDTVNLYATGKLLSESGDLEFSKIIVHTKLSFRAVAYLYSRDGAQKVVDSLSQFYHAYDTHLSFPWRYGLLSVGVTSPIVRHPDFDVSTIGERLSDKIPGLAPWFRRRSERIIHSLMKRIWARVVANKVAVI